jgi:TIR domain-containing protein
VRHSRLSAGFLNNVALQLELIDVADALARAWRSQQELSAGDSRPLPLPDKPESSLFQLARSIADQLIYNCERSIWEAETALDALRGCIKNFASDVHLLAAGTAAHQKAFLSYAREDAGIAQTVERRLSSAGIETWLDTGALAAGSAIPLEIASNISSATHFLVFNSVHSQRSAWVARECSLAIAHQVQHGAPQIVPLLVDATSLPDHLVDRNGINFGDFSQGMALLWPALGVPEKAIWSISQVDRLRRRIKRLIEVVNGCGQADPFITVDEEVFAELEELEGYVISLAREPEHARSSVSAHEDNILSRGCNCILQR